MNNTNLTGDNFLNHSHVSCMIVLSPVLCSFSSVHIYCRNLNFRPIIINIIIFYYIFSTVTYKYMIYIHVYPPCYKILPGDPPAPLLLPLYMGFFYYYFPDLNPPVH
jgi:hypothetical protein